MVTLEIPVGASVRPVAAADYGEYPVRPRLELRLEEKGIRGLKAVCWYVSET